MDNKDLLNRILELEKEINILPLGTIYPKKVRGKVYYYHRYSISGKRYEEYLDFKNVEGMKNKLKSVRN